jgi:hypothetical protein
LHYGTTPQGLPATSEGFNTVLAALWHNKIHYELLPITSFSPQPSPMNPFFPRPPVLPSPKASTFTTISHPFPLTPQSLNNNNSIASATEECGDIASHGISKHGTNAIIDVRLANLDSHLTRAKDHKKVIINHESFKQYKHQNICDRL